jgi:hypothetical protein
LSFTYIIGNFKKAEEAPSDGGFGPSMRPGGGRPGGGARSW